jgi:hypothetical protein
MLPCRVLVPALLMASALGCRPAPGTPPSAPDEHPVPSAVAPSPVVPTPRAPPVRDEAALRERLTCPHGSAPHRAAREELRALDTTIAALGDLDDPTPELRRLESLLASPCLGLARLHATPQPAHSGLALRQWRERGGLQWLGDALRFAEGQPLHLSLPPTIPATLALETHPGHPLAPWLCALHDATCAAATGGWRVRAQQAMAGNEEIRYEWKQGEDLRRCETEAAEQPPPERYPAWARCMFEAESDHTAFPLGGLRAPQEGWLVVEGDLGFGTSSDAIYTFDLETGAAHVARRSPEWQLQYEGPEPRVDVTRGVVPRDNVRELTWMLLVAEHVQASVIPQLQRLPLPDGMDPPVRDRPLGLDEDHGHGGSDRSELHWSFVSAGHATIAGTVAWPPHYNVAPQRHAAELLGIVNDGIVPGCSPRQLPATVPVGTELPEMPDFDDARDLAAAIEAATAANRALEAGLREPVARGRGDRTCAAGAR